MLALECSAQGIWVEDQEEVEKLQKNCFGSWKEGKLWLLPEEALYLLAFQNAEAFQDGKTLQFGQLAALFPEPRLFVRYNAYRDWRDRGLIIERFTGQDGQGADADKKYPSRVVHYGKVEGEAWWYPQDLMATLEGPEGRQLFEQHWLGQFGVYKQDRGAMLALDFLETAFLSKHFQMPIRDVGTGKLVKHAELLRQASKLREYARPLYRVYEDWRLRGYVVKTGFKFGSHFRIYFPGASPTKEGAYIHSQHVLHVFPKDQKLLVSEWSRAVRVAHGVKKTFLLGIPELGEEDYLPAEADFVAYRRKKVKGNLVRETPQDKPRYLVAALAEDEHLGGIELASLLRLAQQRGMELLLSITDRETAITYYVLKKVQLPGSQFAYYEIEWMKP